MDDGYKTWPPWIYLAVRMGPGRHRRTGCLCGCKAVCTFCVPSRQFLLPLIERTRYRRTVENNRDRARQGTVDTPLTSIHSSMDPSTHPLPSPSIHPILPCLARPDAIHPYPPYLPTAIPRLPSYVQSASFSAFSSVCLQLVFTQATRHSTTACSTCLLSALKSSGCRPRAGP